MVRLPVRLPAGMRARVPVFRLPGLAPAHLPSGVLVAGVMAAAAAVIGVLTLSAASAPRQYTSGRALTAGNGAGGDRHGLPASSGLGARVVYSADRHRVWLVDDRERVLASFHVAAGTVPPSTGTHRVFARAARGTGGDRVAVEHIVFFATAGSENIGFSAAVAGPLVRPAPGDRSTAIRETRDDGTLMWRFATIGTVVEVIP